MLRGLKKLQERRDNKTSTLITRCMYPLGNLLMKWIVLVPDLLNIHMVITNLPLVLWCKFVPIIQFLGSRMMTNTLNKYRAGNIVLWLWSTSMSKPEPFCHHMRLKGSLRNVKTPDSKLYQKYLPLKFATGWSTIGLGPDLLQSLLMGELLVWHKEVEEEMQRNHIIADQSKIVTFCR